LSPEEDRIIAPWEKDWARQREQHTKEVEHLRRATERAIDTNKVLRAENKRLTREMIRHEVRFDADKTAMRLAHSKREGWYQRWIVVLMTAVLILAGSLAGIRLLGA